MTKRQTKKSVKKVLQKRRNYGILYVKLGAALGDPLRGLEDPLRTGNKYVSNKASTSDGDIFFKKNWRQICTAAAKLILKECFLFFCLTTTCEVISSAKLYIVSLAKTSWRIFSVFLE